MERTQLMSDGKTVLITKRDKNVCTEYKFQPESSGAIPAASQPNSFFLAVWPQIFSSVISLTVVIQAGINFAYSGVLIPQLADDPYIQDFTKEQASWIASLVTIGQPIGCLLVGPLMDIIGRKKTCIISNIPTIFGWILIYFCKSSLWPIYVARIIAGITSGMTTVGIVYTAEITHVNYRAVLLSLNSVNVAFGILITTILGVYLEWHTGALLYGILAVTSFILTWFIPESPYWLANFTNASDDEIKKHLRFLNRSDLLFDEEWQRIQKVAEKTRSAKQGNKTSKFPNVFPKLKTFWERSCSRPLFLLLILFFLQQTSGTYVVIFYTVNIFKSIKGDFGISFDEYDATMAVGILRFVMSLITTVLCKKIGRCPMLIMSSLGMAISGVAAAVFLKFKNISTIQFETYNSTLLNTLSPGKNVSNIMWIDDNNMGNETVYSWCVLISLLAFLCTGALGQMVIPWTITGELLPTKIRAFGSGLLFSYAAVISFFVIKLFPFIVDSLTLPFVFLIFAVLSIVSTVFVFFCIPETFGKHFEDIAKFFEKPNQVE